MDSNGFWFGLGSFWNGVPLMNNNNKKKLSYKLGLIFFTENISHRYDLVLNGITLMGFVAVCWTTLLDGNIDLSITLAIINTQIYLGMN